MSNHYLCCTERHITEKETVYLVSLCVCVCAVLCIMYVLDLLCQGELAKRQTNLPWASTGASAIWFTYDLDLNPLCSLAVLVLTCARFRFLTLPTFLISHFLFSDQIDFK